ncbi:MAG: hypothetical protein JNK15_22880 [Planctomycetes bacterium]|nr:hypothetical protein [Planctomycetota bacterium]
MRHHTSSSRLRPVLSFVTAIALAAAMAPAQGPTRLLGWNDLGMHCMDGDTSVFSILPPFNTFHAQLMVGGHLAATGSYSVTYQAVADPNGSINRTSIGKTDFWQHAHALFGANLVPDQGLAGFRMPGLANTPQNMPFFAAASGYKAEGVPITPYDDAGHMNPYPLLRLVARNAAGTQIAATDIVVPVSAEMACVSCHGSGGNPSARPPSGWLYGPAATDDRLNIVALHDARHLGNPVYTAALAAVGYSAQGLLHTATALQQPVLCASCHGSNALGTQGQPGCSKMTAAMHTAHADARLADGRRLDDVQDRTSCYTCHPGAATRCLRGAMGKAIGADGEPMMSCQDCHGSMSQVGNPARVGWLDEPNCQSCHTGDAASNAGALRFTNVFDTPGHFRTTPNPRFATAPNVPQTGFSLYRFSHGHGGLQCSACHGSPHAIWPSSEANDNLQSVATQGHVGTVVECSACHSNLEDNQLVGPHGMHPTGQAWVGKHQDVAEQNGTAGCLTCHGTTGRGTVLSRAQGDRTVTTQFGTRSFWRGYEVGCYECHNGPNSENASTNTPPTVANHALATPTDTPVSVALAASDPNAADPLTLRIVSQPRHGAVAWNGSVAIYRAWDGYVGSDSFTYAAGDTKSNSNLGTVTVTVGAPACAGSVATYGFGCPDANGHVPALGVGGCPTPGHTVSLDVTAGPANSWVVVGLGQGRAVYEIAPNGCNLRLASVLATTPLLPLVGGAASFPVAIPALLGSADYTLQAFCLDASAGLGFTATPGVEMHVR